MLEGLRTFCLADAGIAALLSTRLFVSFNPQAPAAYPYAVVHLISGSSTTTADLQTDRSRRVQFDFVGTVADCDALAANFIRLLDRYSGPFPDGSRIINIQESNPFGPTRLPDPRNVSKLSQDFLIDYVEQ